MFLKKGQKLYASSFTLVEVCSVICRKIVKGELLIDPLQQYMDLFRNIEDECRYLMLQVISFLNSKLGVEIVDNRQLYDFETIGKDYVELPKIFRETIELSSKINLKTKDLLHLAYAQALSKTNGIRFFLTFNREDFDRIKRQSKATITDRRSPNQG